jgi:hypothetical protein
LVKKYCGQVQTESKAVTPHISLDPIHNSLNHGADAPRSYDWRLRLMHGRTVRDPGLRDGLAVHRRRRERLHAHALRALARRGRQVRARSSGAARPALTGPAASGCCISGPRSRSARARRTGSRARSARPRCSCSRRCRASRRARSPPCSRRPRDSAGCTTAACGTRSAGERGRGCVRERKATRRVAARPGSGAVVTLYHPLCIPALHRCAN